MVQHLEDNPSGDAVELLQTNGVDVVAEAVTWLLNTAMVAERSTLLGAGGLASATRSAAGTRTNTQDVLGGLPLKVPQTRDGVSYLQSLEKGLRSERCCCWRLPRCTCRASPLGA